MPEGTLYERVFYALVKPVAFLVAVLGFCALVVGNYNDAAEHEAARLSEGAAQQQRHDQDAEQERQRQEALPPVCPDGTAAYWLDSAVAGGKAPRWVCP